jgi:putative transposase
MMIWKALHGSGRALMVRWSKLPSHKMQPVRIRQTGEKKGSKRHVLVDGHGVPLSLIVTGANRHDVSQLAAVLNAIIVPLPKGKRFLYADKGYSGKPAHEEIRSRGYIPRVSHKKRKPGRPPKNRRWVVEAAHPGSTAFESCLSDTRSWLRSYEALVCLAAPIICWRKVVVIYG